MKNFFHKISDSLQRMMYGRYGFDELSRAVMIAAFVLLILSFFPNLRFLYYITTFLWIWILFRCYSKNIEKRRAERSAYLSWIGRRKGELSLCKRRFQDRRTHRYFRCKQCKTVMRVKKGKGKVSLTCPKCGTEIIRKT